MKAGHRDDVVLQTDSLSVTLAGDMPIIGEVRLATACAALGGGTGPPSILFYDRAADSVVEPGSDINVRYDVLSRTDTEIAYRCEAGRIGRQLVCLDIFFSLSGNEVTVGFRNVQEQGDLELVSLTLGSILAVTSESGGARMIIPTNGGRLVDPSTCGVGQRVHRYSWVEDSFCQVGAVYDGESIAMLHVHSLDDQMISYVMRDGGTGRCGLGVRFTHRYTGADPSYHRNKVRGVAAASPEVAPDPGDREAARSFVANDASAVTIAVSVQRLTDPSRGWIQAAEVLRSRLPKKPVSLYQGHFVYKVYIGNPLSEDTMRFSDVLDLIRRFHARTGGARQIAYLVGFQHRGHDTGYPDVFTANERAGGYQALLQLIDQARQYGAIVSFHDNYDDAYADSPAWDAEDIATDSCGGLLRGGTWNGKQAYWIALPVYAVEKSRQRIERTLRMYPVARTYHLDVLTASVFRIDFRSGNPSDRDADKEARLAVIRQFAEHGLDVSSEACGLPFIGSISYFWHLVRVPREVYPGDRRVPFTAFIAHGRADYGEGVRDKNGVLDALIYGSFYSDDVGVHTSLKSLLDAYFLLQAPLDCLRDEEMVDYREAGTRKRVTYASGSFVEVDFETQEYRVVVEGETLVENDVAIISRPDSDDYLLYKASESDYVSCRRRVPRAWENCDRVGLVPLLDEREGKALDLEVQDGYANVEVAPGVAYRCVV